MAKPGKFTKCISASTRTDKGEHMVKKILIEIREFLYKIVISNRYTFLLWKGIKSLFTQGLV